MDKTSGSLICAATCWGIALLGGALGAVLLMLLAGWSIMQALFIGFIVFALVGVLLSWLMCKPLPAAGTIPPLTTSTGPKPAKAAAKAAPAKAEAPAAKAPAPAPAAKAEPAPEPSAVVKSTQLAGEEELAARKGDWKYDAAGDTAESQPETLSAARAGGADDLKLLKGVGPKLEQTLNELGFYHFDQIAAWTDTQVAWVDTRLKFKGRIERDGWIEQAKILAAGGETEFSKKSKK